ncbi:pyroglutamyl-peptidase I [Streptomyces paludis]|uniref:pyroglutamyl-peptidase I n=1 Tax=Streptomyces paludis TaxID=2282738 RepID=UPI001E3F470B|nr:pyroglutamyl-peptidase I [Streptomyces paludis]
MRLTRHTRHSQERAGERTLRVRPRRLGPALLIATALTFTASPAPAAAAESSASVEDRTVRLTAFPVVEIQRLAQDVPQEILRRSGFDAVAPAFEGALRDARTPAAAARTVERHGTALWKRAVDRAQGRGPDGGDLNRNDDRPLYWARLGMILELRQWQPEFTLSEEARTRLLGKLERSSRGQDALTFADKKNTKKSAKKLKRIVVTGFDPFTLDTDVRISNPSGATALALDGTVIRTAEGPALVKAAVFPVRWQDFADGTVEQTLRRPLAQADLFATVSQGRVGRIDVERFNGAWRGGFPDNEGAEFTGPVPVRDPATQPQWTTTSLPYGAITAAATGPFPVYDNTSVTEIPAGGTTAVVRPNGPTPGSEARLGGGGNYLSNEIAYRATLLRDRLGLDIPGGHIHTPVLRFGAGNTSPWTGTVTDPVFEQNRADIIAQVRTIIQVAIEAS